MKCTCQAGEGLCKINMGTRLRNKSTSLGEIRCQSTGEIGPSTDVYIIRQVSRSILPTHNLQMHIHKHACSYKCSMDLNWLRTLISTMSYECINVLKAFVYCIYQAFAYTRACYPHNISIRRCDDPISQVTKIRLERAAIVCADV